MMAEEVGFEPTVRVNVRRFSRPVHSTTLPLLRLGSFNGCELILKVQFLRFLQTVNQNLSSLTKISLFIINNIDAAK